MWKDGKRNAVKKMCEVARPLSCNLKGGYHIKDWHHFLSDFCNHWPTDMNANRVETLRQGNRRTGKSGDVCVKNGFWPNLNLKIKYGYDKDSICFPGS